MDPRFVDHSGFTIMGVMIHSQPDKVDYQAFWQDEFMPHHEALLPLSTDKAYYGVWFPGNDEIPDFVAGMIVSENAQSLSGLVMRKVQSAHYAVFDCTMKTIGATWSHIYGEWLPAFEWERVPDGVDIEYYPPEGEEDLTPSIWIPIRAK